MKIISPKTVLDSLYERWIRQYPPDRNRTEDEKWNSIGQSLLDSPPKTIEEANSRIGNNSWTRIDCDVCGEAKKIVIRLDDDLDESSLRICRKCLIEALLKLERYKKNGK